MPWGLQVPDTTKKPLECANPSINLSNSINAQIDHSFIGMNGRFHDAAKRIGVSKSGNVLPSSGNTLLADTNSYVMVNRITDNRPAYTVHVRITKAPEGAASYRSFAQLYELDGYCAVGYSSASVPTIYNSSAHMVIGATTFASMTYPASLVYQLWSQTSRCGRIYVNGVLDAELLDYGNYYQPKGIYTIGNYGSRSAADTAYILLESWDRLLTVAEIRRLYTNPYGTPSNPRFV